MNLYDDDYQEEKVIWLKALKTIIYQTVVYEPDQVLGIPESDKRYADKLLKQGAAESYQEFDYTDIDWNYDAYQDDEEPEVELMVEPEPEPEVEKMVEPKPKRKRTTRKKTATAKKKTTRRRSTKKSAE